VISDGLNIVEEEAVTVMTWGLDAADAEKGTAIPSARPNVAAISAERMLLITQPYISEQLMRVTSVVRTTRTGIEEPQDHFNNLP
jgi:hypothetical protein